MIKSNKTWNTIVKLETRKEFQDTEYYLDFGDGFLNIRRADGIHMEIYPCFCKPDLDYEMITGQYIVDGIKTDIDVELPNEASHLLYYVKKILGKSPKRKKAKGKHEKR